MATRYTDVDQLLLKRWDDALALQDALEDLIERMHSIVEEVLAALVIEFKDRDISADTYPKRPSIWFWDAAWQRGKRGPALYVDIMDFAPAAYGRDSDEHPAVYLTLTDEFSSLKLRESAAEFSKAIRAAVPADLRTKWINTGDDSEESPLKWEISDLSDADRLRMVANPQEMATFIREHVTTAMNELRPIVQEVLGKMTPKA